MFLRITKILITHFGSNFVLRMWFTILAFNKKLSVNEFYQIEDFVKEIKTDNTVNVLKSNLLLK